MTERTLSIVKPNAVRAGHTGQILARFEAEGLEIVATRMTWLSTQKAEEFYGVHRKRPFFPSLVAFMTSGPVVVSVLEGDNAIQRHRDILGATNPAEAADNTLRKLYGESLEANGTHGSDGPDTAAFEISHFFAGTEIFTYDRA